MVPDSLQSYFIYWFNLAEALLVRKFNSTASAVFISELVDGNKYSVFQPDHTVYKWYTKWCRRATKGCLHEKTRTGASFIPT